jgi:hypothetical protein
LAHWYPIEFIRASPVPRNGWMNFQFRKSNACKSRNPAAHFVQIAAAVISHFSECNFDRQISRPRRGMSLA